MFEIDLGIDLPIRKKTWVGLYILLGLLPFVELGALGVCFDENRVGLGLLIKWCLVRV